MSEHADPTTSFFGDQSIFDTIKRLVFPALVQRRFPDDPIRMWITGCASGEDVYSLVILLLEFLEEQKLTLSVQCFATDSDATILKQARAGIYAQKTLQAVSAERLERFFIPLDRKGGQYQISKEVRACCIFAPHMLTQDPRFSRMDLIYCRNSLLDLVPFTQEQLVQTLHYALNSHGFLLLAAPEQLAPNSMLFTHVEHHPKLFTKTRREPPLLLNASNNSDRHTLGIKEMNSTKEAETEFDESDDSDTQREADRLLLTRYVPASVIIDADMQIHHVRGDISPYLVPASGKATLHMLKWARDGLKLGLRVAVEMAHKEGRTITRDGLQISGTNRMVQLTVVPLNVHASIPTFLVLFEERAPLANAEVELSSSHAPSVRRIKRADSARVMRLEKEVTTIQAEVQMMLEVHSQANEDLLRENEDLQSKNEELQSINEELETAQAELQCINEELQIRNTSICIAQDYAESIIETIPDPLVVINAEMRTKSANTAFYQFFQVTPFQVEHHLFWELENGQWDHPQIRRLLEDAQAMKQSFYDFEIEQDFPTIGHKVLRLSGRPIISGMNGLKNHLLLLSFEDSTERKEMERQQAILLDLVNRER